MDSPASWLRNADRCASTSAPHRPPERRRFTPRRLRTAVICGVGASRVDDSEAARRPATADPCVTLVQMPSVVDRPPRPQRTEIGAPLRGAIFRYADEKARLSPAAIWNAYREEEYYASLSDAVDGVCERYGLDCARVWAHLNGRVSALTDAAEQLTDPLDRVTDLRVGADARARRRTFAQHGPRLFLEIVPDREYLTALEAADRIVRARHTNRFGKTTPGWPSVGAYAARAFREHGLPWAFTSGRFTWTGDPVVEETTIAPALMALRDPRLGGASREFARALRNLRRGGHEAYEQAVGDAGKAVESAMASLLDANGTAFGERDGARRRWQLLMQRDVLPPWTEHIVLGASLPRNRESAHGSGVDPRRVEQATAIAAVGSAATAITLIAGHLPSP